jgi:division protein CdvB (Snf7/Vps24/ESCRT-III family)
MTSCEKPTKLIDRMQRLVTYLNERNNLILHQQVNQFFYMQKIEELKMLLKQLEEINKSLDAVTLRIHEHYSLCFAQWSKDARWVNLQHFPERPKSIL